MQKFAPILLSALILLAAAPAAYAFGRRVEPVGAFTDMRHTSEHAYGHTVMLWRDGEKIFGLLVVADGQAADAPAGLLEGLSYDARTYRLRFRARLSTGFFTDGTHDNVPSQDVFNFRGRWKEREIKGVMERRQMLDPRAKPARKKVLLARSEELSEDMQGFKKYRDWRRWANKILRRCGPKW